MTLKRLAFAAAAVLIAVSVAVASLFAADLYLHKRVERSAGLNVWGYRGPVAGKKRPGEIRVVVLGGSTVFGYGLTWDQAFPVMLEHKLNETAGGPRFSVVNLGYNNEGSYSFRFTLEDYAYLQPDVVCLYEGYNDLMGDANGGNPLIYRHQSSIFRATGYLPILPLILREKALAMRFGGDLNKAYAAEGRTVFQPTLAAKATSGALDAAANIGQSLERQFARLGPADPPRPAAEAVGSGCAHPWIDYCQGVSTAIDYALHAGHRVLFVTQPYLTGERGRDRHRSQQRAVVTMLEERYASRSDVGYVNLGDAVDLREPTLATDGMHLTPAGNGRIAEALVQPVFDLSRSERRSVSR